MTNEPDSDALAESGDADAELMQSFCAGREEAFVELYRRYRDRIFNFCRRLLGSAALGEEAAQDVFLKLYRAKASYAPRSRFSTYLYTIAQNHCFNLRARRGPQLAREAGMQQEAEQRVAGTSQDPAKTREVAELRRALGVALECLPDKQRAALVLCHYDGFSQREAAVVLGVSESALKALLQRAKDRMMRELRPYLAEPRDVTESVGVQHVPT